MEKNALKSQAQALQNALVQHRRVLHQIAETGFDLPKTRAYITQTLEDLGVQVQDCGKASIVAQIGKGKRTVLLRADMDALPIQEQTGLAFACDRGNMHACGHDLHATMLLGAAMLLKGHEKHLSCTVRLLFQAAEERLEGAKDCIKHGVLVGVDHALMLHVLTGIDAPSGTLIIAQGESAPSADCFTLNIIGKSCHGAAPQNGVDANAVAARVLLGLEEIIAKETPATANAVLTVGKMYGGKAGNAIADKAALEGTLRGFGEDTRTFIKNRIKEVSQCIAKAFRAKASVRFQGGCPSLVNDETWGQKIYAELGQVFDERQVLLSSMLSTNVRGSSGGSEDFAYIAREVPSVMLALCAGETGKGYAYPLHHPKVDFDESVLWVGALAYALSAT